jgi:hypothetical protein
LESSHRRGLGALGELDNAILYWQHITQNHSYPRAKVQLAELMKSPYRQT